MTSPLDVAVFVLSVACGVLGIFLLMHKGVRLMRGGLLHTVSIGLAVIGIAMTLASVLTIAGFADAAAGALVGVLVVLYYLAYTVWTNATKIEESM